MSFPIAISIGGQKILVHTLTEFLAFFVGFRYYLVLRKKQGDPLPGKHRTSVFIACLFGALIGSRLLGGLENPAALRSAANKLVYFYQNKTVLGALLGGLLFVEITKYYIGETRSSGDLYVYPILLALIMGRIGCFCMGVYEETYGNQTRLPWGMDLGDGLMRHPVALYEMLFLSALWISIFLLEKRPGFADGGKFKFFLIAYLFFRLCLDFIKPHFSWAIGLSSIQFACLAGLGYYFLLFIRSKNLIFTSHA